MVDSDMDFLRRLYNTTRRDILLLPISDSVKDELLAQQFDAQHNHYQKFFSDADFDIVLAKDTRIGRLYVQ